MHDTPRNLHARFRLWAGRGATAVAGMGFAPLLALAQTSLPATDADAPARASRSPASAPTYYFSDCQPGAVEACVAGNNASDGLKASTAKRNTIGFNVNTLPAGTRLLFARGGAWAGFNLRIVNLNATPTNPIVFDAYGTGPLPLLKTSSGVGIEFGAYNELNNDGGYMVRSLKFDGNGTGQWALWLRSDVRNVTIDSVEVTGFETGIHSQGSGPHGISALTVRNSKIHSNRKNGLLGGANEMLLEGNLIIDNNADGGAFEHGAYLGGGGRGGVIRNNVFANNSAPGGICNGGNLTIHGKWENLLIEGNTITQTAASGGCYGLSITPGYHSAEWFRGFTVRGNTIINVGGCAVCAGSAPGIVIEDNTIVNLQSTGQVGILIPVGRLGTEDDADTGAVVRNNTIYFRQAGAGSVGVSARGAGHVQVVSNLIYFGAGSLSSASCFAHDALSSYSAFDHNLCHHASGKGAWSAQHATASAARAAGFDARGRRDDPQLTELPPDGSRPWRCQLGAGSPAIAAGHASLSSQRARNSSRSAPDIGACGRAPN